MHFWKGGELIEQSVEKDAIWVAEEEMEVNKQ